MITFNEVYSKVRTAVLAVSANAFVTSTYTPTPSKFPAVFVREVGRFTPIQYISLNNTENVKELTLEIQVYSNKTSGAKTEADTIMSAAESALKAQYFYEVSASPAENADASVYRTVARFRRIIADADTINS